MNRFVENVETSIAPLVAEWRSLLFALAWFVVGAIILRVIVRMLLRAVGKGLRDQSKDLLRKAFMYVGLAILLVIVLNAAGVSVGALLGAAGVLGIAIGIASQTSLSNVISGLFLVSERFFEIGDVVKVGEMVGVVHSVDLLSVKVRAFDNVLIRIPNQQLIEQNIINLTRFPIRRMDFTVTIAVDQSIDGSLEALGRAMDECDEVLAEPPPFLMVRDLTANGWQMLVGAWFEHDNYVTVRNTATAAIQRVFAEEGIRIVTTVVELITHERDSQI